MPTRSIEATKVNESECLAREPAARQVGDTPMQTRATDPSRRETSFGAYKNLHKLTIGGGLAFWVTTFAFSLLPIAAEYRAAFSIDWARMVLVESLLGGLIVAFGVSYCLLRFFQRIPTRDPVLKSSVLSAVAWVIALVLIQGAATRVDTSDAWHYVLIGALLNVPRFLILGIAIGYLYEKLDGSASS